MRRFATALPVLGAALIFAVSSAVRGDDEPEKPAEKQLDKQYLGRRAAADERVAGGFLGFAKTLERRKCGDRAKAFAQHVLVVGSALQAKEAQVIIDRVTANPTSGTDASVEAEVKDAIERYKKGYEDVITYCERKSLADELADAKARLAAVVAFLPAASSQPPSPPDTGGGNGPGNGRRGFGGRGPGGPGGGPGGGGSRVESDPKICLDRVNLYRKNAGLPEVKLDQALSDACKAHADYLTKNDLTPEKAGLKVHKEDSSLPGYSSAGAGAAQNSVMAWHYGASESVDCWMRSFYHRVDFLAPSLTKIGLGVGVYSNGSPVTVLDARSGRSGSNGGLISYPADKLQGVPTHIYNELPDPLPASAEKKAGFPVTLTGFGDAASFEKAEAVLETQSGVKVDCHFSCPESPASSFDQLSTICLIPKGPLQGGTTYKATFKLVQKGQPVVKVVTFTTGS